MTISRTTNGSCTSTNDWFANINWKHKFLSLSFSRLMNRPTLTLKTHYYFCVLIVSFLLRFFAGLHSSACPFPVLQVRRLYLWYRFRLKHRCLLWSSWLVLFLVCARWIAGFTTPGSLCVQAILIFRFTFFSLNGPYYFLTSLLTWRSHFCMILLIYRFLPVFSSTSSQTFVDSSLINRALNGPYCSPLMIIGEFIFYIFLSVTLPCTFTSYLRGKSLLGFSRSSFINESFVTKSSPSEL